MMKAKSHLSKNYWALFGAVVQVSIILLRMVCQQAAQSRVDLQSPLIVTLL
jgi:hypothetical protein